MRRPFTYDVEKYRSLFERNCIYIEGFKRNVFRFPNRKALINANKNTFYTYRDLNYEVNKLSNAMLKEDLKGNDLVLYMLMNCPEFAFIYLATQKIGCINCPINFKMAPGEVSYIIDESKPVILFVDISLINVVVEAINLSTFKPKKVIIVDADDTQQLKYPFIRYEEFVSNASESEPEVDIEFNAYDEVTRLYTSGTTGIPKGFPINNINEVLASHDLIMHLKYDIHDVLMNISPWFHRGGLYVGGPNPTFYLGGCCVSIKYFHPRSALEYIEKYKVSVVVGVPTMFYALLEEQKKLHKNVDSLEIILSMGAPLERDLCTELIKVFTNKIYNACGTSETLLNEILTPYDLPERAGQTGRAAIDDDVRIVKVYQDRLADPDELVAMDDKEVGEIAVKTIKGTLFYFNNEEEMKTRIKGDWFYPGDLATWDQDQYITIRARKDDMIIVGGNNIYPAQIEEIINRHPKILDSAIVGANDTKRGKILVAYIVKKDNSLTIDELRKYVNSNPMISPQERPRYYIFVDELPRTATGKKQHYKLRKTALEDVKNGKGE
jgi:acyl-coenzyme A synthetase/AMP-(fatty) acid ligase